MEKVRAKRNRTITISNDEIEKYINQCVNIDKKETLDNIKNKVVCGDIFKLGEFLPDKFVDLLIVDPPYNLSKIYNGTSFKKMDDDEYEKYTRNWMSKIVHTLKENASIYVCCDWRSSMVIGNVLKEFFIIQNRITWQREKGRGALSNWKNGMEDIWFATVSNNYTFNVEDVKIRRKVIAPYKVDGKPKDWTETENGKFRDTYPSNFWDDISIPYWSMPENTDHPTQKPEKLLAKLILASSNEGDVIFDPFLGSGTTAVTAKKLKRNYFGIELEKEYCALAGKRLEMAEDNTEIQGYNGGVFWERNSLNFQKQIIAGNEEFKTKNLQYFLKNVVSFLFKIIMKSPILKL